MYNDCSTCGRPIDEPKLTRHPRCNRQFHQHYKKEYGRAYYAARKDARTLTDEERADIMARCEDLAREDMALFEVHDAPSLAEQVEQALLEPDPED